MIGDVEVAGGVHGDTAGTHQLGAGGWATVAQGAPAPGHGGDEPGRDFADAVAAGGDVEVAGRVHSEAVGIARTGAGSGAVVSAADWRSVARHGGNHPARDLEDAIVKSVGDVQVAGGIHGDGPRLVQLGG